MSTSATPSDRQRSGVRAGAYAVYRVLGLLFAAAVIVQFTLAGLGIFGADGASLGTASSLDPHRMLGTALMGLSLLMLIAVLIARPGRGLAWVTVGLLVATGVTGSLASAGVQFPLAGAMHVLVGVAILGMAGRIAGVAVSSLVRADTPRVAGAEYAATDRRP